MDYIVCTQHTDSNEFVTPVCITADSHIEAAEERFSLQANCSKENTTAILVIRKHGGGNAQIFHVKLELKLEQKFVVVKP